MYERTVIPVRKSGSSAACKTREKVLGAREYPKGRTLNWYALPWKKNLRYLRCWGWIPTWKYASFKSMLVSQSPCVMLPRSTALVSMRNCFLDTVGLRPLRSRMGRKPSGFLCTRKYLE